MESRGVILFSLGVLVGYAIIKATSDSSDAFLVNQKNPLIPSQIGSTQIKEPEVIEPKETLQISECKEKWIKHSETIKFASIDQKQAQYNDFMTNCMSQY